jgi:aminodeoxyfutalosine synthase
MDINLAIADRARAGERLTAAELDELASADLLSLGMLADEVRRSRVGDTVTYVRVLEWSRRSSPESARAEADRAGEVRIVALPESLDDAIAVVKEGRLVAEGRVLAGFSLADIVGRSWAPLVDVLKKLKAAGLDAVAEAPMDRIEHLAEALQACRDAAISVHCLSLHKPAGDARTDLLIQLQSIVARFPDLHAVAPLPREQSVAVPTTGYDDVRAVAMARLALPSVRNIQVDWAQYGPKLAQVALTFGANDLDRVSPIDDETLGRRRMAVEDVKRNIAAAGFTPVERP